MAQMTKALADEAMRACAYGQHPALTVHETEQLLRAWFEREVLRAERDHARATIDNAVRLLTGIHALMYPAPVTTADGRTMVFRPNHPDPHIILQELSDRIRALPDEIARNVTPNVANNRPP